MGDFVLYFAGAENLEIPISEEDNCGKLYTFALGGKRLNKYLDKNIHKCKTFIDSGAFSMYHSGVKIDIDEYIEYINTTPSPTVFAELDVIPYPVFNTATTKDSSEGSWEKYLYMMKHVKEEYRDKILPVFHLGEPYSALERMLNTEVEGRLVPYICLGGRHGSNSKQHDLYYSNVFNNIISKSKNPKVKVHALGMTVLSLLEKYPFYSADSTTWLMIGANGGIQTDTCGMISVSEVSKKKSSSAWNFPKELVIKLNEEVERKGFTLEQLSKDYRARHSFNAIYFRDWANNYHFKGDNGIKRRRLF